MRSRFGALFSLAFAAAVLPAGLAPRAQDAAIAADARRFEQKLARIVEERPAAAGRRTTITERELNAYFAEQGASLVPPGVVDPRITILGDGRVTGRATVNLDAVRDERPRGWLDPLKYLGGRVPVSATGVLHTRDGVAWLDLEAAEVSGVRVPKPLLDELVRYYSRTPENPEGFTLDDRVQLPAGIRSLEIRRGEAVVVQ